MTGALANLLFEALSRERQLVSTADGSAHSGRSLHEAGMRVAAELREAGVQRNEPVLVAMGNRPTDLAGLLGAWMTGAVAIPVHRAAAAPTVARILEASLARFLVDEDRISEVAISPPPARPLLDGAALVIFTSGTTGRPKGVVLGHDRFRAKLDVLAATLRPATSDVVVVPLQLTFIFGLWVSLLALREGAQLVMLPKFTPEMLLRTLGERAGTILATVPTMLRLSLGNLGLAAGSLRQILVGGESLGASLSAAIRAAVPQVEVVDLYGLTETGSCDFCLVGRDQVAGAGTIGAPTQRVSFRLVGEDGSQCAGERAGELQIDTPFGMLGYLDDPALTQASLSEDFFKTGDLARLRPDGRVELIGRTTEMINRAGAKIAPAEIDAVMAEHPEVADCVCAGVPDQRWGEAIHALVVLKPGSSLSEADLQAWLAARIESYKIPETIHFVDTLPLGPTGKLSRSLARERIANAIEPCGT